MTSQKLFLKTAKGAAHERVPFWFMRQAGRYLPEYRELRASTKGFLDLCFTPEKAAEVTVQPIRRFGMDAAILFSDILVIPYALGTEVRFAEGEGPIVGVTDSVERIQALSLADVTRKLAPIAETIRLVRAKLAEEAPTTALIGFAGAPWTVACYMLQGKSGKEFIAARKFALAQPALMQQLIDTLTTATLAYLEMQIEAGAEALQIFDSWAGLLPPAEFARWVTAPTQKIIAALKQSHPHIPLIGFAKGAGLGLPEYARITGADTIGIDQHTPMEYGLASRAYPTQTLQGNLDPLLLAYDKTGALRETERLLKLFGNAPVIFNVGHGFIPETPIDNVAAVSALVKGWRR